MSAELSASFGQSASEAMGGRRNAVELYVRTYSTMLQSSGQIRVSALQQAHLAMQSSLHPLAADPQSDMGALLYSVRRLPLCVSRSRSVVMGQSPADFSKVLGGSVTDWQRVTAPARRRWWYFDGRDTMAVFVASSSDIDDLVPVLVAYQIEWNKLHRLAQSTDDPEQLRTSCGASADDWSRLIEAWQLTPQAALDMVKAEPMDLRLRLLSGSHLGYARAARDWWSPMAQAISDLGLSGSQLYFVSSNMHSLVNMLSGVGRHFEEQTLQVVREVNDRELIEEWERIHSGASRASRDNWLYYATRHLFDRHPERQRLRQIRGDLEAQSGIKTVLPNQGVAVGAQVVRLNQLHPDRVDARIGTLDPDRLKSSTAGIVNIDYPLGLAAYHLFCEFAEQHPQVAGVYILGKAATLNADVGDVLIPNLVFNEHSGNTYWLDNCFCADDVSPHLMFGSVLDNQRAVAGRGTYLQNRNYLDFYYHGRFTVLEMEAGPYLDAVFEATQPSRHPINENINAARLPFDLGVVHYASDTPYTQARTLGARGLSYRGMDSTYASAVAILRRILGQEGILAGAATQS